MTERRTSQLLRGVLDACLLAVIEEAPAYGYEITRRLGARGLTGVADGSNYPVLGRLERDGLVEGYREAGNGGPPRKYYRLTSGGSGALAAWTQDWSRTRSAVDHVLGIAKEVDA
jgi:PadR family transcriptional regulator PadR